MASSGRAGTVGVGRPLRTTISANGRLEKFFVRVHFCHYNQPLPGPGFTCLGSDLVKTAVSKMTDNRYVQPGPAAMSKQRMIRTITLNTISSECHLLTFQGPLLSTKMWTVHLHKLHLGASSIRLRGPSSTHLAIFGDIQCYLLKPSSTFWDNNLSQATRKPLVSRSVSNYQCVRACVCLCVIGLSSQGLLLSSSQLCLSYHSASSFLLPSNPTKRPNDTTTTTTSKKPVSVIHVRTFGGV
ncbi:hypothetical protein CONLIGDRAFT_390167 [Coniochaeta ligniaria NRRL 30616]|uniref:Uncharacterized protein n=1 Tax=Coniochaeta ligniaria NRRL 30616 TaxID=1408157 RepID=A0A1J7IMT9_9PEZI|nr:hypothetical protein CONLIGDRAFT_390167 [Coniochaeta ligniaria NRRL 30616]